MNVSILGIVSPAGSNRKSFCNRLKEFLESTYEFDVIHIKLNELIYDNNPGLIGRKFSNKILETKEKIQAGNKIRKDTDNEIFAYFGVIKAISAINQITDKNKRTIIILDQLKRTDEINCLKSIFGKCFFSIGIVSSESDRISNLTEDDRELKILAEELIAIDENEGDFYKNGADPNISEDTKKHGQQVAKCILMSDVLVSHHFEEDQVKRFFDLLLGHPYLAPSTDEFCTNLAFAVALKALDLSRQVGAVITNNLGDVISVGYNEVNRVGGGPYEGLESTDMNDFILGYDPNKKKINEIKENVSARLSQKFQDINKDSILKILNSSMIDDLTEFHRATHAEMNALFSAQRSQSNIKNSVLYSTTFPCHNCCKHLISAGVREVVYLEPYKKSSASELHGHEITYNHHEKNTKVYFRTFLGVTHNRFEDLFAISSISGAQINRKDNDDKIVEFPRKTSNLRYPLNSKFIRKLGIILSQALTKDSKFDTHMYKDFIKTGIAA